jgi:hypothetical protein
MKNFLFSFCMLASVVANAQSSYGCTFSNLEVLPGDKFRCVIGMTVGPTGTTFNVGSTNFRFNFNKDAITAPVIVGDGFPPPDFGTSTTTGTNNVSGTASINTVYSGANNGGTVVIGVTSVPLVTLEFNIINPALTPNLAFRLATAATPRTTVLDDDKTTTILQNPAIFVDNVINTPVGFNIVLPIDLLSFTAIEKDAVNEILWVTAREENVRLFVVERSLNGTVWTKLGEALPNKSMRYSMVDANPAKITYYRLRNIDSDTRSDVSDIAVVNRKAKDSNGIKFNVSPNPTADVVKVNFYSGVKGTVTTTLMNVAGQVLHTQIDAALSNDVELTTYNVDMNNLPAGTYFLKVSSDKEEMVETIVKQ